MAGLSSWLEDSLSPASQEKARVELNETPERVSAAVDELREAFRKHCSEHKDCGLSCDDATDNFFRMFLRARKYNIDRSLTLLVNYLTFRQKNPGLFEGVTFETIRRVVEHGLPMALKGRDCQGRRVMMFRPALLDPNKMSMEDVHRSLLYALDALIEDEETQVNGFIMVEDWSGMTMWKMIMFDSGSVKKIIDLFQDCFPARFKEMHLINHPWFFNILWGIAKPFLKEKLKKRITMHGTNMASLHKHVPPSSLPSDMGGTNPPYSSDALVEFLSKANVKRPQAASSAEGSSV